MTATLTAAQMLAAIADIQARHTVHPTDPGALGEEPGERVVSGDLDEWAAAAWEDSVKRSWP
jgi:hypothetical protein